MFMFSIGFLLARGPVAVAGSRDWAGWTLTHQGVCQLPFFGDICVPAQYFGEKDLIGLKNL
jgi:hypothetical protein